MLKHKDIIEKLDPLKKVALAASGLGDEALESAGVPAVGKAFLGELGEKDGLTYESAARSWNPGLVGRRTDALVRRAGEKGAKLVVTPDLKVALDPYRAGLGEDPFLTGEFGAEIVRAAHGAGAAVGLSRLSVSESDVEWLDRQEDKGAIHDLVAKPFLRASAAAPCEAILLTPNRAGNGYIDANRALFNDAGNGYFGKDVFLIGDDTAPTAEALTLLRGKVSLGGARLPLERASRRYRQLTEYKAEGTVNDRDVEEALRDGSALDDARLDAAADEIVDFAERVSAYSPEAPYEDGTEESVRLELAAESIVLLKNDGTLPLAPGKRVAVIGEAYEDVSALAERYTVVGRAAGYERETDRSDALIPEAVRAASEAEVALVFLYPDATGKSLSLPANRIALLAALRRTGKPVVALVCGDACTDMSFDKDLAASLIVPADGPSSAEALARILTGESDPSGRLTRTLYDGADDYFRAFRAHRDDGWIRVGSFVGYRRYDSAGETVRYPFGYGLGYTEFQYSRLTVSGGTISFTLENTGNRAGVEVVQLYVGAPSSSRIAPKKTLKGFRKIFLKAGESSRLTFRLSAEDYATFDYGTFGETVEAGTYRIYVCSSAQNVRLVGKRTLTGVTRAASGESAADYFPNGDYRSAAEIRRENRVGRAKAVNVSPRLLQCRRTVFFAMLAVAFLFFLILTMVIFSYYLDYALFSVFDVRTAEWVLYVLSVAVIAMVPLLGSFRRKRLARMRAASLIVCPILLFAGFILGYIVFTQDGGRAENIAFRALACLAVGTPIAAVVAALVERDLVRSRGGINKFDKYYHEREHVTTFTSETEFEDAFRALDEAAASDPVRLEREAQSRVPQFYDRYLTFEVLMHDSRKFAEERGVVVDEATLRNWLAALMSSQLIIVPKGDGAALASVIAEYFGKRPYIDNAEDFTLSEDLFSRWKQSERDFVRTGFQAALEGARKETVFLHTALLRHADASRLGAVLEPIADVLARRKTALTLPDGSEEMLPANLRIVVEAECEGALRLPAFVAEVAAVLDPHCKEAEPVRKKTIVQAVGYERFAALRVAVRDEHPLPESAWKQVDRLDSECRSAHIGNILWLKTEMHASVALAAGANEKEALDGALAAEALPWIAETWNEEENGGTLSDELASVFGKNGVKQCRDFMKARNGKDAKR